MTEQALSHENEGLYDAYEDGYYDSRDEDDDEEYRVGILTRARWKVDSAQRKFAFKLGYYPRGSRSPLVQIALYHARTPLRVQLLHAYYQSWAKGREWYLKRSDHNFEVAFGPTGRISNGECSREIINTDVMTVYWGVISIMITKLCVKCGIDVPTYDAMKDGEFDPDEDRKFPYYNRFV